MMLKLLLLLPLKADWQNPMYKKSSNIDIYAIIPSLTERPCTAPICINTTGKEIKRLVPSLAEYCLAFWDN